MLQDAVDVVADHFVYALRTVVEGGGDGEDGGAGFGDGGHVADVNEVEGGFAGAEDEGAAFFEADVGGAVDEVFGEAVGDGGEGAHGAGHHQHGVDGVGAAGDGGADVFIGEQSDIGSRVAEELFGEIVASADAGLFGKDAEGAGRGDEIDAGDAGVGLELAEGFYGDQRAAGAGDRKGDGDCSWCGLKKHHC